MKVLAYPTVDGTLSIIIPAPGYTLAQALANPDIQSALDANQSAGLPVQIEDTDLPADRLFRKAWTLNDGICMECPVKSKEVAHEIRRAKREEEFAPHDRIISLQLPGAAEAEAERVAIRDKYAVVQTQIDECETTQDLRAVISNI